MASVQCSVHGAQQQTLVCQHIAEGLSARRRVGFFWTAEVSDDPRPNAWCLDCENRVRATGGEWVDLALEHLQPKVLCVACYDLAKDFHLHGKLET